MKKKRIIILAVFLLLLNIVSIGLYLTSGYVPILGAQIANRKLSSYIGESVRTHYEWTHSNNYSTTLADGTTVRYDLDSNTLFDPKLSNDFKRIANIRYSEIMDDFPVFMEFPESLEVNTWIDADHYNPKIQSFDLRVIYNPVRLSALESAGMPAKLAMDLMDYMGSDYNVTSIHLIYADQNGMYTCTASFESYDAIDYKALVESTIKLAEEQLPEDYKEWLASLANAG